MRLSLEKITNLATVAASVAVCFAVGRQYLHASKTPPLLIPPPGVYQSGEQIKEVRDVNFASAPRTLVLFVRSNCHFCELSMPFYKALSRSPIRRRGGFRLVAASIEDPAITSAYLKANHVLVDQIVSVQRGSTKVRGTPTLILVDRNASVVKAWAGYLPKDGEEDVLKELSL